MGAVSLVDEMRADPMLLTREVAGMCGVDVKTVREWIAAGRIAAVNPSGKRLLLRQSDVLAALGLAPKT